MKKILFLCTGNYYRSRFAEEYFNHVASEKGLNWEANSRGLSRNIPNPDNPGPISVHVLSALTDRSIKGKNLARFPIAVTKNDLEKYDKIIALSEQEHRPMLESCFNGYVNTITFFEVGDLPLEKPGSAIKKLATLIEMLVLQVSA
jgi:protein-tyrosine phosphatase